MMTGISGKRGEKAAQVITGVWAALMLTVFPVIYSDFYFNILETKFVTFCILVAALAGMMFLWSLVTGRLVQQLDEDGRLIKKNGILSWIRGSFTGTELFMAGFFLTALIATANSAPYLKQAVTGNEGRFTGMFYIILLTVSFFLVSGHFRFRRGYITAFFWFSWFICLFGISDFFKMNLLHFRDHMLEEQYGMFMSTLGNINTYTIYVGFVVVLAGVLFILSRESLLRTAFFYVTLVISFAAMVLGNSDNGYLSLLAFFGFVPFAAFGTWKGTRRYFLSLATFFAVLFWAGTANHGNVIGLDGISRILTGTKLLLPAAAVFFIAAAALYAVSGRKDPDLKAPAWFRIAWTVFAAAVLLGGIALLVTANGMTYEACVQKFGAAANYLKFRDEWGTNRGYVWRAAMEEYGALPASKKLTGTGPDTFAVYMMIHRWNEMQKITGQVYDSAHNEYIQYLFTIGPVGLFCYLGVLATAVCGVFRKAGAVLKDRDDSVGKTDAPYLYALGFLVICYAVQATVNINIPIATPIMWVFVMIAVSLLRQKPVGTVTAAAGSGNAKTAGNGKNSGKRRK